MKILLKKLFCSHEFLEFVLNIGGTDFSEETERREKLSFTPESMFRCRCCGKIIFKPFPYNGEKGDILLNGIETGKISDGYHTFDQLYDHRCLNFIAFVKNAGLPVFRTTVNFEGQPQGDWFILYTDATDKMKQISYHLPMKYWVLCEFAETTPKVHVFDKHNGEDVLARIREYLAQ
ncbi:hypothetical protein FACS189428_2990 [Clostridia bacterium]|nr:hypothetical protein FACS189428_2990 [Clostridia bacterium]